MRIISGKLKGTKLFTPLDEKTRPLKDIVKESIFNALHHSKKLSFNIKNARVLDLYSGTGSFGLECLSREASHVTFVENNKSAQKILLKNIDKVKVYKKILIIKNSVFSYLTRIENFNYKFDLVFLDPPYREENIFKLIIYIYRANILRKNGIIIIHRHKKSLDPYPKNFSILDVRKYGISKIAFGNFIT